MKTLVNRTNIVKIFVKYLEEEQAIKSDLDEGNLLQFETKLSQIMSEIQTQITEKTLQNWVTESKESLIEKYKDSGFSRCEMRTVKLQIQTGKWIEIQSPYARQVENEGVISRHLVFQHFSILGNGSPSCNSKVAISSMLCPSYDIGNELLNEFGIEQSETRTRRITNELADYCFDKEVDLVLKEAEDFTNKRVVLSIDGGRCNTRENRAEKNEAGNLTYETAWCEPKLFTLQILKDDGSLDEERLPIYSCRFSDADMWGLLKLYLEKLKVKDVKSIQVLADGAPWIWNNISTLLEQLGVPPERIVLTLDYYHAASYVHKLIEAMPSKVSTAKRERYLKDFKTWLWEGKCGEIVRVCKSIMKRPNEEVTRWLNYFDKHKNKTHYSEYQQNKLMCGSGIIESGIRRIINLRFKNAGTFWAKNIVEKLFF